MDLFEWAQKHRQDTSEDDEPKSSEAEPGPEHGKSSAAWEASSGAKVGEHVQAHRQAAEAHGKAQKAQDKAGNPHAAKAHQDAMKSHEECADSMEKSFGKSHLY